MCRRLVHHKTTTSPLLCGFNIAIFNQVSTAVVMWHVHSTVVHLYTWTQTTRTFPRIHPFLWGNASLKNTNTCEVANNTLHTRWPLLCGRDGRQSHGAPVPGYHTCTASQTENSHVKKMRKYSRWLSHWFWAKKTNNLNLSPPTSVPFTRNQPDMTMNPWQGYFWQDIVLAWPKYKYRCIYRYDDEPLTRVLVTRHCLGLAQP